jgi:GNAT superfamily N-acetyltransferase
METDRPIIRWATDADQVSARLVVKTTWHDAYIGIYTPAEIEAVFAGELRITTSRDDDIGEKLGTLLAEVQGVIVGVARLYLLRNGDGEFIAFYVLPASQKQGIGVALWEASLAAFRERGCAHMEVWTVAQNTAAIGFYQRRGASPIGECSGTFGTRAERLLGFGVDLKAGR